MVLSGNDQRSVYVCQRYGGETAADLRLIALQSARNARKARRGPVVQQETAACREPRTEESQARKRTLLQIHVERNKSKSLILQSRSRGREKSGPKNCLFRVRQEGEDPPGVRVPVHEFLECKTVGDLYKKCVKE